MSVVDKATWYRVPGPLQFQNSFSKQLGADPNTASPEFMRADLAKSGLTPEDVYAQPKFLLTQDESAAYYLPFFDLNGEVLRREDGSPSMCRIRRQLSPQADRNAGKYVQPSADDIGDLAVVPYLPRNLWDLDSETLLICEGEKKTACCSKYLQMPAIGIGGCYNWRAAGNRIGDIIHPWILEVLEHKQPVNVVVVPDGDVRRYDIARAYGTLITLLREKGYNATMVELPDSEDKIDDLIVAWGDEALPNFLALNSSEGLIETPMSLTRRYSLVTEQRGRGDDARQQPVDCEANYIRLLDQHPQFNNVWYDIDHTRFMVGDRQFIPEVDDLDILTYFQRNLGFHKSQYSRVNRSISAIGKKRSKSPFLDWLASLTWDGTPRLETMFIDYCSAPDVSVVREIGSKWLPAACHRLRRPGCKVDYMVIATGTQAIGKSSFPNILWGKDNTVDFTGHFDSKDTAMIMHMGLCVNWEELATMSKKDISQLKAMVTATHDTFRAPYSPAVTTTPRNFVLYGSVNDPEFLPQDATGQRRYAIVPFGQVQFKELEQDREQLWAEAYASQVQGWEAIELASENAKQYVHRNEHYEQLMEALEGSTKSSGGIPTYDYEGTPYYAFSLKQVLPLAGLDGTGYQHWTVKHLQEYMRANGWEYHQSWKRINGTQIRRVWVFPVNTL